MFKIAICDDEMHYCGEMESLIVANKDFMHCDIETFSSGHSLCNALKDGALFDLIFMDIEMANCNGIEAGKWIRGINNDDNTLLIYVSGHDKYCLQLFDVQPFNFIKKPINPDEFNRKLISAYNRLTKNLQVFEFIVGRTFVKVKYSEIMYFEVNNRKITAFTNNKQYEFYSSLKEVISQTKSADFLQIHKAYYVNLSFVQEMRYDYLILTNGVKLFIGESKRAEVKRLYMAYLGRIQNGG